ncbi:MAG: hypothetical protein WD098_03970 [Balneolales bacterium]
MSAGLRSAEHWALRGVRRSEGELAGWWLIRLEFLRDRKQGAEHWALGAERREGRLSRIEFRGQCRGRPACLP